MDEVKNYPPYLDYPKPYKAEVSIDCINRKAFIGEIEKHYCAPCKGQDGDLCGDWCRSCVINSVLEKVREFPAADVAAVVRCEDCLYSTERYGHMECIHGVSYRNTWNKPDFFCAYGERKEGAD